MKTLTALLASLALYGCGGLDESLAPEAATANDAVPALEDSPPGVPPEMTMPTGTAVVRHKLEISWTKAGLTFQMVQNPVEERFLYPVDLNAPPPGLPTPPCPACR